MTSHYSASGNLDWRFLVAAALIGVGTGVGIEDDVRSLVMCVCLVLALLLATWRERSDG